MMPMIPLLFPIFISFFIEISEGVKVFDLFDATPSLIFNNESIVKLHDYGTHILIGGRNAIYNVSLNEYHLGYDTIKWNASKNALKECEQISDGMTACHNDIRVFYPYRGGFVLCGTHALNPMCARFEEGKMVKQFSGLGQTPFQSEHRSKFFVWGGHIFTATASDPLLLRKDMNGSSNSQLRSPRQGAFEEPEFIDLHSNYQDVLLWFTETPMDTERCGMRKETRVARICARDPGAARPYETEFSSFSKARIECSIKEDRQDTLHFNQLRAVKRIGSTRLIGVFQSQLAGLGASALCEFDAAEISKTLLEKFEKSPTCPRATSQDAQLAARSNPMVEKKISSKPFYYAFDGKDRFTSLLIEENFQNIEGKKMDVIWIGTDRGNVIKLIKWENSSITHVSTMKIANEPIQDLSLLKKRLANKNTQWTLIAVTESGVHRSPSSVCSVIGSCLECTQLGDPMCAWITDQCVQTMEHLHRQDFMHRSPSDCVELPRGIGPFSVTQPTTSSTSQRKKSLAKESLLESLRSPNCLCERREETTPCTTEVIQNEVPSRGSFLPCLLFLIFGCFLGACTTYLFTWYCRSPKEKQGDSPSFDRIDAYTSPSTTQSMYSDMSTRTGNSTGNLIRGVSKQTYC